MRRIIKILAVFFILGLGIYGFLLYQNNRQVSPVGKEKIAKSYEQSVSWLLAHREKILRESNPILWWMLGESARMTHDERVQKLYDEFRANFDRYAQYSVWQAHFRPEQFRDAVFSETEYRSLVEYQQYFLYGLTCSKQLAKEPLIQAQHNPNFCWHGMRIIRPACVTHQLMAYRMAQNIQCPIEYLDTNIAILQDTIEKQLRYDPRVVDVYIQRVLMLVDSGARERINNRWIERVLNAQLADGGWSHMQPLIPVGGETYFGFNATAMTFAKPTSNFHATAQGVLLMSLLLQK
ncbi:MAG: hypothetical protein QM709_03825 [Spongiibacteraceae bacterium]